MLCVLFFVVFSVNDVFCNEYSLGLQPINCAELLRFVSTIAFSEQKKTVMNKSNMLLLCGLIAISQAASPLRRAESADYNASVPRLISRNELPLGLTPLSPCQHEPGITSAVNKVGKHHGGRSVFEEGMDIKKPLPKKTLLISRHVWDHIRFHGWITDRNGKVVNKQGLQQIEYYNEGERDS